MPLLTYQILVPLLGALGVLGFHKPLQAHAARWFALGVATLSLVLAGLMAHQFEAGIASMQLVEQASWIPMLHLDYRLGVDGLSMPLVVLTALTHWIIVASSWSLVREKVHQYLAAFLLLQAMVVGVFTALDGVLFYLFWEGMLIPMVLCVGIWGSERRSFAAMKFFIYTFMGSALMLLALMYLGSQAHHFRILDWAHLMLPMPAQQLLLAAFVLAFAIKVPMWPVHTWLPDAHTEAPAGGSVILAALMLKVGAYGFFRFCLPITSDAALAAAPWMIALSLVAIVSIGLVAMVQEDMKRLIAYSSVAHMGFVTLGCFIIYPLMALPQGRDYAQLALEGGWVQMISHAFGSGALFLAFGLLYDKLHTRRIGAMGGIANVMPRFSAFFVLFALTNVGLPGTAGFVGEFMVLMATFKAHWGLTALAGLTVILSATYTLGMVKRVFFGPVDSDAVKSLVDVSARDTAVLGLLAAGVLVLGVAPALMLTPMHATAHQLITLATHTHLG